MDHTDGLVQDSSNSRALAMELLQSCAKPSIWPLVGVKVMKYNFKFKSYQNFALGQNYNRYHSGGLMLG